MSGGHRLCLFVWESEVRFCDRNTQRGESSHSTYANTSETHSPQRGKQSKAEHSVKCMYSFLDALIGGIVCEHPTLLVALVTCCHYFCSSASVCVSETSADKDITSGSANLCLPPTGWGVVGARGGKTGVKMCGCTWWVMSVWVRRGWGRRKGWGWGGRGAAGGMWACKPRLKQTV